MSDGVTACCPGCGQAIPAAECNVATDLARCVACNQLHQLSSLVSRHPVPGVDLSIPPAGVRVEETLDGVQATVAMRSWVLAFLIPFTALWSGGSMTAMVSEITKNGFGPTVLFFVPFAIGTIVLVSIILVLLFGSWTIRIGADEVSVRVGLQPFLCWTRTADPRQVRRVALVRTSFHVNHVPQDGIELADADGKRLLCFGAPLRNERKAFLAALLHHHLVGPGRRR